MIPILLIDFSEPGFPFLSDGVVMEIPAMLNGALLRWWGLEQGLSLQKWQHHHYHHPSLLPSLSMGQGQEAMSAPPILVSS